MYVCISKGAHDPLTEAAFRPFSLSAMDACDMSPSRSTLPPPPAGKSLFEKLEELIESGYLDLPILSTVAAEVVALTSDEDCDSKKLADVIRRDQAMAGHFLRLANSAAQRGRSQVVSLHQAMSRLGMMQVRQFAFVISCQNRVFRVSGREEEVRRLFKHSLATALYAQEIARIRRSNVEEAFLSGLLHDVGRPVLLQAVLDLTTTTPYSEDEIQVAANELHAYVGGELVREWNLADRLVEAIAHHHHPASAPTNALGALTVRLADDFAHQLEEGGGEMAAIRAHPALAALNLYPNDVERLLGLGDSITQQVEAMK